MLEGMRIDLQWLSRTLEWMPSQDCLYLLRNVFTASCAGLKMDNATVRIAAGLRLGAPIVRLHVCVCGKMFTADGLHGLSCRHGPGRHSRHYQVNDLLCRAFVGAGTLAKRARDIPALIHSLNHTYKHGAVW
jgi:hypothetical protein